MTQGEGSSPSQRHLSQHEQISGQRWRRLVIFMSTCETPFLETKLFLPTTNPFHQQDYSKEQLVFSYWTSCGLMSETGLAELSLSDLDMECKEVSNFPFLND